MDLFCVCVRFKCMPFYAVGSVSGGTADISVHEKLHDGTLREVRKSTGGPWGGRYVEEGYLRLLESVFGSKALKRLKSERMGDYLKILTEFETQKRTLTPSTRDKMTFTVSKSLMDFSEENGELVKDNLVGISNDGKFEIDGDNNKLLVDPLVVKEWFDRPLDSLVEHVNKLLDEPKLRGIETVLLVGGFGESLYVKQKMTESIKTDRLVVPDNAGIVILLGAVRCGHIPNLVSSKLQHTDQDKHYALFDNLKS